MQDDQVKAEQNRGGESELLRCPFCNEGDFDAVGLKSHLLHGDCEPFNDTSSVKRV